MAGVTHLIFSGGPERDFYFDRNSIVDLTDKIRNAKKLAKAIVIESEDPHIFCLGFNPEEFRWNLKTSADRAYGLDLGQSLIREVFRSEIEIEVRVPGLCLGAGLELVMAAQRITLSDTSRMKFVEFDIGLIPGYGGAFLMAQRFGRNFLLNHAIRRTFLRNRDFSTSDQQHIQDRNEDIRSKVETLSHHGDLIAAQHSAKKLFLQRLEELYPQ